MGKILLQSRAEAGVLTGFTHLSQMTANMIKSWGCFVSISLCTCIPMEMSLPRLHKMVNIMNNVTCKCCQNIDFSILKYLRWFQFSIHRYYQLCFLSLFSQTWTLPCNDNICKQCPSKLRMFGNQNYLAKKKALSVFDWISKQTE